MLTRSICFNLVSIFALVLLAGCAGSATQSGSSASAAPGPAMETPQQAVIVSGGNSGNATIVYFRSNDPSKPLMLSTSGAQECPYCRAAAIKYFQTGVLEPKCPMCGATRTAATSLVTPNVGHQ
jgi:hypothetical protein